MSDIAPRSKPQDVFSKRAPFYATNKIHDDSESLSWLIDAASPHLEMIALDVGTGAGHASLALSPHVRNVFALDVTEEMIREAMKLSEQRSASNIHFILGDATKMPFPDDQFDLVVSRRAGHHFLDIHAAVNEMVRVLKPGGRLVIDDRSVPEDEETDRSINCMDRLHDASHIRDYRLSEWKDMLNNAGMELKSARMYSKRLALSHFTDMVDEDVAEKIRRIAMEMSDKAKEAVNFDEDDGSITMDNFYVLIASVKK